MEPGPKACWLAVALVAAPAAFAAELGPGRRGGAALHRAQPARAHARASRWCSSGATGRATSAASRPRSGGSATREGRSRLLARVEAPPDERGTGLPDDRGARAGTEMFSYLPELGRVRRVTSRSAEQLPRHRPLVRGRRGAPGACADRARVERLPDAELAGRPVHVLVGHARRGVAARPTSASCRRSTARPASRSQTSLRGSGGRVLKELVVDFADVEKRGERWLPRKVPLPQSRERERDPAHRSRRSSSTSRSRIACSRRPSWPRVADRADGRASVKRFARFVTRPPARGARARGARDARRAAGHRGSAHRPRCASRSIPASTACCPRATTSGASTTARASCSATTRSLLLVLETDDVFRPEALAQVQRITQPRRRTSRASQRVISLASARARSRTATATSTSGPFFEEVPSDAAALAALRDARAGAPDLRGAWSPRTGAPPSLLLTLGAVSRPRVRRAPPERRGARDRRSARRRARSSR